MQSSHKFNKAELEKILKDYMEKRGFAVDHVNIVVGSECVGYGAGERNETVFKYAEVVTKGLVV